ncbi:hypothetical protein QBC44DRAFT_310827 [Cladorrhinum sp. PSN332]|nr:hypothetical protein QBC44DRAFT_310827 [Cladorrhinum sp. PSN332]
MASNSQTKPGPDVYDQTYAGHGMNRTHIAHVRLNCTPLAGCNPTYSQEFAASGQGGYDWRLDPNNPVLAASLMPINGWNAPDVPDFKPISEHPTQHKKIFLLYRTVENVMMGHVLAYDPSAANMTVISRYSLTADFGDSIPVLDSTAALFDSGEAFTRSYLWTVSGNQDSIFMAPAEAEYRPLDAAFVSGGFSPSRRDHLETKPAIRTHTACTNPNMGHQMYSFSMFFADANGGIISGFNFGNLTGLNDRLAYSPLEKRPSKFDPWSADDSN